MYQFSVISKTTYFSTQQIEILILTSNSYFIFTIKILNEIFEQQSSSPDAISNTLTAQKTQFLGATVNHRRNKFFLMQIPIHQKQTGFLISRFLFNAGTFPHLSSSWHFIPTSCANKHSRMFHRQFLKPPAFSVPNRGIKVLTCKVPAAWVYNLMKDFLVKRCKVTAVCPAQKLIPRAS